MRKLMECNKCSTSIKFYGPRWAWQNISRLNMQGCYTMNYYCRNRIHNLIIYYSEKSKKILVYNFEYILKKKKNLLHFILLFSVENFDEFVHQPWRLIVSEIWYRKKQKLKVNWTLICWKKEIVVRKRSFWFLKSEFDHIDGMCLLQIEDKTRVSLKLIRNVMNAKYRNEPFSDRVLN